MLRIVTRYKVLLLSLLLLLPLLSDNHTFTTFLLSCFFFSEKEYFLVGGLGLYDGRMVEMTMNVCPTESYRSYYGQAIKFSLLKSTYDNDSATDAEKLGLIP